MKRMLCLLVSLVMVFGMLSGCGNSQSEQSAPTQKSMMQFDSTLENIRVVVDGIVHNFDVQVADGAWYISAEDAATAFGGTFSEEYVALDDYAQSADIRYTKDEVLTAAYFSTWEPYADKASLDGFESYADELNMPLDKIGQETISGAEMAELLDYFVKHEAPEQMEGWNEISVKLRSSNDSLIRSDALAALFLASWKIGGRYMEYEKENHSMQMRDAAFQKADDNRNWELFNGTSIPGEFDVGFGAFDHYGTASCIFNLGMLSPVDASYPFHYDGTSFRHDEKATYLEAIVAILRVYSTNGATVVSVDDPAAVELSGIFTEELLNKASAPSTVTAKNHPQWTGIVMNGEMDYALDIVPGEIADCANWGFNSVRLNLDYKQIFDVDATNVDLKKLQILDQIVAQAVKYNLHLNIMLCSLPGSWVETVEGFERSFDLDLYVDQDKQAQAKRVLAILAERYKNISNDYLSFTPLFEPFNKNRSTGEVPPEYSFEDYDRFLGEVLDVIWNESPERLIILEPWGLSAEEETSVTYTSFSADDNVIHSFVFGEMPFVYANMTGEAGRNIDDENRSFYLVDYPTYYYELDSYIVDPQNEDLREIMPVGNFEGSGSLLIDGCLPAGTVVEIYLRQTYGGQLEFVADGDVIYTEELGHHIYNVGETLSGYIWYATSNKKISVTLTEDVELLEIATPGGAAGWTAMDIWLPENYARERWYYATPYDVSQGFEEEAGLILKSESRIMIWPYDLWDKAEKQNHLTIYEDLTYSTPTIRECATRETIDSSAYILGEKRPNSMIRYGGTFNGSNWAALREYYSDIFDSLNDHNVGWWFEDWYSMKLPTTNEIAGEPEMEYMGYSAFNLELLKLMQQYQNSERP